MRAITTRQRVEDAADHPRGTGHALEQAAVRARDAGQKEAGRGELIELLRNKSLPPLPFVTVRREAIGDTAHLFQNGGRIHRANIAPPRSSGPCAPA
jgi:hypothetical protein